MPLSFMSKSFEKIIEDKDIEAGLEYLYQRTSTIKAKQIITMIKQELAEKESEDTE